MWQRWFVIPGCDEKILVIVGVFVNFSVNEVEQNKGNECSEEARIRKLSSMQAFMYSKKRKHENQLAHQKTKNVA